MYLMLPVLVTGVSDDLIFYLTELEEFTFNFEFIPAPELPETINIPEIFECEEVEDYIADIGVESA
jgi:hypothetical protein